MATFKITGGPDLKARLSSVANGDYTNQWATDAANRMRSTKPASKEAASNVFTTKVTQVRGAVYGAFWWIFVDRGTKAHDITIRKKRVLSDRTTIFGTQVAPRPDRPPAVHHQGRAGRARGERVRGHGHQAVEPLPLPQ